MAADYLRSAILVQFSNWDELRGEKKLKLRYRLA